MFVSLFVRQTQTKDFCEAFKGNGFRMDYSFSLTFPVENKRMVKKCFIYVIGSDYWVLNDSDHQNYSLVSRESSFSDAFGPQYSTAFTLLTTTRDYFHGFLRVGQINLNSVFITFV